MRGQRVTQRDAAECAKYGKVVIVIDDNGDFVWCHTFPDYDIALEAMSRVVAEIRRPGPECL